MSSPSAPASPHQPPGGASPRLMGPPEAATVEDSEQIVALFTEVFGSDPVWSAIAPDDAIRREMIASSFRADLSGGGEQDFDVIRDADSCIVGALHFTSPGRTTPQEARSTDSDGPADPSPTAQAPFFTDGGAWTSDKHDGDLNGLPRRDHRAPASGHVDGYQAVGTSLSPEVIASSSRGHHHDEAVHAHRPEVPHWYFRDLVIAPSMQGAGLGSTLLASRLETVDRDPAPVFLESTSPASRRLYERFGFQHVATVEAVPGGTAYVMIRPSQRA